MVIDEAILKTLLEINYGVWFLIGFLIIRCLIRD